MVETPLSEHDYFAMAMLDVSHHRRITREGMKEMRQLMMAVAGPGIKVYDHRTARKLVEVKTGIYQRQYSVCRNQCFCFAADPDGAEGPYCLQPRYDDKGRSLDEFFY